MSKISSDLYESRKNGETAEKILITFRSQEEGQNFSHPHFHGKISIPLGDSEWCQGGTFRLEHLEELEADERIHRVDSDPEMKTMPVGDPIEF